MIASQASTRQQSNLCLIDQIHTHWITTIHHATVSYAINYSPSSTRFQLTVLIFPSKKYPWRIRGICGCHVRVAGNLTEVPCGQSVRNTCSWDAAGWWWKNRCLAPRCLIGLFLWFPRFWLYNLYQFVLKLWIAPLRGARWVIDKHLWWRWKDERYYKQSLNHFVDRFRSWHDGMR